MPTKLASSNRFNLFYTVSLVLAVMWLLFLALNLLQGPRLRRAEVDKAQIVKQSNQRLTMYANQPLDAVKQDQIKIEPTANFMATSIGDAISIRFTQRLRYNTTYKITVNHVSSPYRQKAKATFNYSFRTADPTIFYIHRNHVSNSGQGVKKPDQIMETTLSGTKAREVYSAARIQDYIISGSKLAVVMINDNKTNSLFLTDIKTKHTEELKLPAKGTITNLRASPNQKLIGFRFSSNENNSKQQYERVLFNINIADRHVRPIVGLDKKPLQIIDWQFAPDGTTILAHALDENLLLIDTSAKHDPVPLGQFTSISNFSHNGAKISADSSVGPVLLDPIERTRTNLQFERIDGVVPYLVNLKMLSNGDGYIARLQAYSEDYQQSNHYFLLDRDGSDKVVYKVNVVRSSVNDFALSPNDQYLAVEQNSIKDSLLDQYPDNSKSYTVHTQLVDISTGKPIKDIDGFGLIWD